MSESGVPIISDLAAWPKNFGHVISNDFNPPKPAPPAPPPPADPTATGTATQTEEEKQTGNARGEAANMLYGRIGALSNYVPTSKNVLLGD